MQEPTAVTKSPLLTIGSAVMPLLAARGPLTAKQLSYQTGKEAGRISGALYKLWQDKRLQRKIVASKQRRKSFEYALPTPLLDGFNMNIRRTRKHKAKALVGVREAKPQAEKLTPPLANLQLQSQAMLLLPVGERSTLELSLNEARALHAELGAIFGGLASSTK